MSIYQRTGAATHESAFAANFSTTDLRTVSKRPQAPALQVDFKNDGATVQNAVFTYTGDSGTTTIQISPGQTYPVERAVDSIDTSSGADVSCVARWWHRHGCAYNA